jgi:PhzF family phenazine biosynthesis protein
VTKGDDGVSILLGLRIRPIERVTQYKVDLLRVLNIQMGDYDSQLPIARSDDLFVPVRRLHTLFSIKPSYLAIANFLTARDLRGMCVYTTETIDRESVVHSRFFAPHIGINEDPVTGSSHGTLALLLYESGLLHPEDGRCVVQAEQGDAVGRRGRLTVELTLDGTHPAAVRVGGTAVTVLDGEMLLPE